MRRHSTTSYLQDFRPPERDRDAEAEFDVKLQPWRGIATSALQRRFSWHKQGRSSTTTKVEARGGRPSRVKGTARRFRLPRFDFGAEDETLEMIGWDEFFKIFDENGLALLEQEETSSGEQSRFSKFIRH